LPIGFSRGQNNSAAARLTSMLVDPIICSPMETRAASEIPGGVRGYVSMKGYW
jgi:hypothetical protein